jgi:sec-independent protein translocase protein TatA
MIPRIGPMELVIIVLIVLIIFGAGNLPQVGGAIGNGIREFRRAKERMETIAKQTAPRCAARPQRQPGRSLGARSS